MYTSGKYREVVIEGYVARANADGTCEFVPWHKSDAIRARFGQARVYEPSRNWAEDMRQDVEAQYPIRRRTPQERVAAMVMRLMLEAKEHGTVPGLPQEKLREIVGEYWKNGITEVTEDMVRKVAAHYMSVAEIDNKEADRKRVTRAYATT